MENEIEAFFKKVDCNNDGIIQKSETVHIDCLNGNPVLSRLLLLSNTENSQNISFEAYKTNVKLFLDENLTEPKIKLLFKFYDANNDGFLTVEDLATVLVNTLEFDEDEISKMEDKIQKEFDENDKDKNGKLDYGEFYNLLSNKESWLYKMLI